MSRTAVTIAAAIYLAALGLGVVEAATFWEWNPPKRYDHPYKGKVTIRNVNSEGIIKYCGGDAYACAYVYSPTRCTIYLPIGYSKKQYAAFKRHEIGHCNGWAAHHPD